ncbi:MAG: outer membrane protein assembly factor BamA [Endomicrobium sp.]|jgi:outer membrane protein insertion porin family|nr:outer membrane protein assembly factor BamA [Endomicrobium sp.]
MNFRLLLVFFILFFTVYLHANDTNSNLIVKVCIKGLCNVKEREILSVMHLKKGKYYSVDDAREDVRSITGLEFFDDVEFSYDESNGTLIFVVKEKPYIERIVFKGNSMFSSSKLKDTSLLKEKDYYSVLKLEETKQKIINLYKDAGYVDCQIEVYPTIDKDTNSMTITFIITENNRITISGIDIKGVVSFKKKKILSILKTKAKKVFREQFFKADLEAIQAFYKDNGFVDYEFISFSSMYNESRTKIFITLNIKEGKRYKIGFVTYEGNLVLNESKLKKMTKFKKGQIFNQRKIIETIRNITSAYYDNGYLYVDINPKFNKTENANIVDINIAIVENSLVYVGNVYIDGLVSTKENVIRREIILNPADVLAITKFRKSVEKIYNLGFIETVEPQILPTAVYDVFDLFFSVNDGRPGSITAGVGYSSIDKLIGSIRLQHLNLFGLGQKLNLSTEFGSKKCNFEVDWTEPWIFNRNVSLILTVFDIERKRDYGIIANAYNEHRKGLSAKIGPRISDSVGLLFGYVFEHVQLCNIDNRIEDGIKNDFDLLKNKTASIFGNFIYDTRDYIFDASRGTRQLVNLQVASTFLGGNIKFIKGITKSTWFLHTFWNFVLSFNIELGMLASYSDQKQTPLYERFYIGGDSSVRGYKYRTEIGPVNGGQVKSVANIEYKFPIVSDKGKSILQGVLFYDIGGVWQNFKNINLSFGSKEENLHSGVGFEIRLITPVMPIRFGWGYGLNHKRGEQLLHFYFNIGNVF